MSEKKQHKVWFRDFDGWWYVHLGTGRRRSAFRLAKGRENKRLAIKKYRRMLADGSAEEMSAKSKVKAIFLCFLTKHAKRKCSADTCRWYRHFLKSFCQKYGTLRVGEVRPLDVENWLDGKPAWGETTRNRAITCLIVAFNWAVRMKVLRENPIKGIDKGSIQPRERIVTHEERRTVLGAVKDKAFKLFLFAMGQTGARPSEVRRVTAAEFLPSGLWVFPPRKHKTGKKTKRPRVVYLTPPMLKLCERLARERAPGQPLFLNTRSKPWTANALRCRFRHLRTKFPQLHGVTAYVYRHSFATQALKEGVPIAQVAELLGHSDIRMIQDFYGHLSQLSEHLREAATTATRPRRPRRS
jgi:integrase